MQIYDMAFTAALDCLRGDRFGRFCRERTAYCRCPTSPFLLPLTTHRSVSVGVHRQIVRRIRRQHSGLHRPIRTTTCGDLKEYRGNGELSRHKTQTTTFSSDVLYETVSPPDVIRPRPTTSSKNRKSVMEVRNALREDRFSQFFFLNSENYMV